MIQIEMGLAGKFRGVMYKADSEGNAIASTAREVIPYQDNLITNGGMNAMAGGTDGTPVASTLYYLAIGTGTTPPSFSDTGLTAQVANVTNYSNPVTTSQITTAPYFVKRTIVYRFAAGVATGILGEVGLNDSNGNYFTHALLKDIGGNPTTVTKLSDEILDVIYDLYFYIPSGVNTGSITLDGTVFNYTIRAIELQTLNRWLYFNGGGAVIGPGGGNGLSGTGNYSRSVSGAPPSDPRDAPVGIVQEQQATSAVADPYVSNSYVRDVEWTWGLDRFNTPGWRGIAIDTFMGSYLIDFGAVVPKTASKSLKLKFRFSWARRT